MEFIDLKSQYRAMQDAIQCRIQTVLEHGHYIMGPEVDELEDRLATYTGARHCITVSSGTDALLVALMAIGIVPGDEIITTPFSFVATAEVIVLLGAVPVFVDVEPETGNINAALIEDRITHRTRAIMPVSLYGQPADMAAINDIASRHALVVIEDGAQSFGATYQNRKSGNLSTIGCTSFFPSKPLGCYGDGGAIFTNDDDLACQMRAIRVHGQLERYVHTCVGIGGRMDTLQCAIVLAKLERFEWEIEQRNAIAARYDQRLDPYVRHVQVRSDRTSVFAQYTVMVEHRQQVQMQLRELRIPTAVHYPVIIPHQPAYRKLSPPADLPVANALANSVLSLPMGPYLDTVSLDCVADALLRAIR